MPRDRTLEAALLREQGSAARTGNVGSSRTILRYSAVGGEELGARAGIIWAVIRRSHASLFVYTATTRADLQLQIHEQIEVQARKVAHLCVERVGNTFSRDRDQYCGMIEKSVRDRGRELTAKFDNEAEFYVEISSGLPARQHLGAELPRSSRSSSNRYLCYRQCFALRA